MSRESDILKVLMPYVSAFPNNTKIKDEAWPIYASVLSTLTPEEVNMAMRKLLVTAKFFPTIAEIFEAAQSIREQVDGTGFPSAADAWEEVQRLAKSLYLDKPWTFSHEAVERAAKAFGKYELCTIESNAVGVARAHFMKMYAEIADEMKTKKKNDEVLATLPKAKGKIIELAEAKRAHADAR